MTNTTDNNKRIAKNTMLLYFRMIFMMVVSLYTSRVILKTLGIDDYGIFNVVGGVVSLFSFINGAMAGGTQRYLTFALGKKDLKRMRTVFCTCVNIHLLISAAILLLAETIGLWFFYEKMSIPADRLDAAFWVYQFSILSAIVMVVSVPYNATIIAHEKMSAFAYISVLEVVLKLLIVYLLTIGSFDKLKLYALLFFCVQLAIRYVYGRYCKKHFEETHFKLIWDGQLIREMAGFAGWNLLGNCAYISFTQGLNILLNMFFGPAVNAARGVAIQVQGAITSFSGNFQTALNPQITKAYAAGDFAYMHTLVCKSSKFTFFLLYFLSLPVLFETDMLLSLWLKDVPEYTIPFLRIILAITMVDAMANPLMISAAATGKVKVYQTVVSAILLAILPISYGVLKAGANPTAVFVVHFVICNVAFVVRLFIIRSLIHLSVRMYFQLVIVPALLVAVAGCVFPYGLKLVVNEGILSSIGVMAACVLGNAMAIYGLGLDAEEKHFIQHKLAGLLRKWKR